MGWQECIFKCMLDYPSWLEHAYLSLPQVSSSNHGILIFPRQDFQEIMDR